jgi:hypothetical protein
LARLPPRRGEPKYSSLAFEDGYDMYADGSAVALANLMYMAGPVLGDGAAFERMLGAFVDALRPSRPRSLDDSI